MTIDHNILNNLQQPKFDNPLAQYANYLAARNTQNEIAKYDEGVATTNALNAAYKKAYNPTTGKVDRAALYGDVAQQGRGSHIPTLDKAFLDNDKTVAETGKAEMAARKDLNDVIGNRLEFSRKMLDGVRNPQQASLWIRQNYQDPYLAKYHAERGGSLQQDIDQFANILKAGHFDKWLRAMQLGAEKALETHLTEVDQGNKIALVQTNKFGPAESRVVGTYAVAEDPNRPRGTTVNVNTKGETAYIVKSQEKAADRDDVLSQADTAAPELMDRSQRIKDVLASGKIITGFGSNFRLQLGKALAVVGENDDETIRNTETLAADLAHTTLESIKLLGIGARGLDTQKEREFLESFTGKKELDAKTIQHLAELAEKTATRVNERWKARYNSIPQEARGAYEPPVNLKKNGTSGIPQSAINDLKRNPGTAAQFDEVFGPGSAARVLGR